MEARLRGRGPAIAACAALSVLVTCFWLLRILWSGSSVDLPTSDLFLYYLPIYETLYGELLEGSLPTWNPYQLGGLPGLASLQAGFFYPGHFPYLLLPVFAAFAVSSIGHLSLLAIATFTLVRRIGLAIPASLAAAIVVALRGRYPQTVIFPNMLEAAAWLPVGAIAVLSLARGGGRRAAAGVALAIGMSLLAGYPQLSVYVVYSWGALLLIFLAMERASAARWLQATSLFALGLAAGALLAGIQLVPGFELTGEGTRSPGPLTRWEQFPFGWYGPGIADALTDTVRSKLPELPLSLGAVGLVLVPLAFAKSRFRVVGIGSLVVAGVVLLFAMGPATPFFDWIATLPALAWFRFPRRSLFMFDFFVALALAVAWCTAAAVVVPDGLAGKGVVGARRVWLGLCAIAALLVVVLSWPTESFFPALRVAPAVFAISALGVLVATAVFGRSTEFAKKWCSRVPIVLVALLSLEIGFAELNRSLEWSAPTSLVKYHREREIYRPIQASTDRVWLRSLGIEPALPPKLATYFEMRSVGDYEPLNLRRQAEYFTYLMEGRLSPARQGRPYSGRLKHLTAPTYPGAIEARGHLLDVAAVRWFVVSKKAATRGELAGYVAARGLVEVPVADPHLVLLENPHAVPRAFVVYDVEEAPEPAILLERMSDPAFEPLVRSYAEPSTERPLFSRDPEAPERGHAAEILHDGRTRVEVAAKLAATGMLVLSDSFYPGWRASVGGRDLEILATNHLFRGVELPAGDHRITFEYVPDTLFAGAGVSLLGVIATLLLLRGARVRRRLPANADGDSIPPEPAEPARDEAGRENS